MTLYNGGQISSAAFVAYLGARHRKTSARATFMMHRATNSPQPAGAARLQNIAKSLAIDDERSEAILREHVEMPAELWAEMQNFDLFLPAEEAVKYKVADEIADFAPPHGTKVFNLLG